MLRSALRSSRSDTVFVGDITAGAEMKPFSYRLTLCTSFTCSDGLCVVRTNKNIWDPIRSMALFFAYLYYEGTKFFEIEVALHTVRAKARRGGGERVASNKTVMLLIV